MGEKTIYKWEDWEEFLNPPNEECGETIILESETEIPVFLDESEETQGDEHPHEEISLEEWTKDTISLAEYLFLSSEEQSAHSLAENVLIFSEEDEGDESYDEIEDAKIADALQATEWQGGAVQPAKSKNRRLRKVKLRTVTEDDFDDEKEKKIVRLLKVRVQEILDKNSDACRRQVLVNWFFAPNPDEFGLKFTDLSLAMGCFPWLVRERLVFYLAKKRIRLQEPLDILAYPPDEDYMSMAYIEAGGDLARRVLSRIWSHPGVSKEEVIVDLCQAQPGARTRLDQTIERLMETRLVLGIVDQEQGFDYRNPMLYAASRKNILEYEQSNKTS